MSSDELSDAGDSDSNSNVEDLMNYNNQDGAMANLAATGLYTSPVGIAAGMAIASSSKKRNKGAAFETNPSTRKRIQTRLIRKLKSNIDEYTARIGQQAVILLVTPQKSQNNFKVFGAKPLEDVIRACKPVIMNELEQSLAQQAPPPPPPDEERHELPPLVVDGIPTPVEKMTQAQLRAFIPLMLKYSTGKGKPGWGKEETRPPWWPDGLPWANVRSDARSDDEKTKISWTHALRQIVVNCYTFHGRQDLLPASIDDDDKSNQANSNGKSGNPQQGDLSNLAIGIVSYDGDDNNRNNNNTRNNNHGNNHHHGGNNKDNNKNAMSMYAGQNVQNMMGTQVVTTIQNPDGSISLANPDGTMSLVHFDPSVSHIITLPDGTQAQAVLLVDAPPPDATSLRPLHQ